MAVADEGRWTVIDEHPSANERFKARYDALLAACLGRSILLHVLVLLTVPGAWLGLPEPVEAHEIIVCTLLPPVDGYVLAQGSPAVPVPDSLPADDVHGWPAEASYDETDPQSAIEPTGGTP